MNFSQQNKTTFVLVGAGHIGGENGLLKTLEKKGYVVTRNNTPSWDQAVP